MKPAQAFVNFFAQAAGAALVLTVLYFAETRFWPVVTDFQVHKVERTESGISFSGDLVKGRPCEFVGLTVYGIKADGKRAIMNQFKTDIFGANVGTGAQSWGPVTVPGIDPTFHFAEVQATHRCHPLWLQTTTYIRFDLSKVPQ